MKNTIIHFFSYKMFLMNESNHQEFDSIKSFEANYTANTSYLED